MAFSCLITSQILGAQTPLSFLSASTLGTLGLGVRPPINRRTLRLSIRMPIQTPIQMRLIKWPSPAASLPWSQGAAVEN